MTDGQIAQRKNTAALNAMQAQRKSAYATAEAEAILLTQLAQAKGQTVDATKDFPVPELCGGFLRGASLNDCWDHGSSSLSGRARSAPMPRSSYPGLAHQSGIPARGSSQFCFRALTSSHTGRSPPDTGFPACRANFHVVLFQQYGADSLAHKAYGASGPPIFASKILLRSVTSPPVLGCSSAFCVWI
jgi:hypothetical protein